MILCRQISDVIANENARYKRNELEFNITYAQFTSDLGGNRDKTSYNL